MKRLLLLVSLSVLAFGCAKAPLSDTGGSGSAPVVDDGPDLKGAWAAEVEPKGSKTNDVGDALGNALANVVMGALNFKIRIFDGHRFRLTILGMPVDGHFTASGKHLVFTAEKFMNKTREELREMNSDSDRSKISFSMTPMEAEISEDNQTFTLHKHDGSDNSDEDLIFRRVHDQPEGSQRSTVSADESNYVGHWTGMAELAENARADDQVLVKGMAQAFELDLNKDNTFNLDLVVNLKGTWSVRDGNLVLRVNKALGFTDSSGDNTISLSISSDGKTLKAIDDRKGKLTFSKKDD